MKVPGERCTIVLEEAEIGSIPSLLGSIWVDVSEDISLAGHVARSAKYQGVSLQSF